jgi:cobalt-zinc-cadmium efflux system protein
MAHDHHHHHHAPQDFGSALKIGIVLNLSFVVIEFLYGKWASSMALVADAGHNLSDVLGLAIALGAALLSRRRPTSQRTYGYRRSSILAALANGALLLAALGAIAWEALQRLSRPEPIATGTVIVVALIGIAVNAATAWLFAKGRKRDLNVESAFLHMAADAAISLGVVVAALAIRLTGWLWLDPATSLAIVAVVFWSTLRLLRDSLNLALDAVPSGVDPEALRTYLCSLPQVVGVHDLHVWGVSTSETVLTAHIVLNGPVENNALVAGIEHQMHHFGIGHTTIQLEIDSPDHSCECKLMAPAQG